MPSSRTTQKLVVSVNDTMVGEIVRLADDRTVFSFDQGYASNPHRPVLSLSFKAEDGGLIQANKIRRQKLEPFFSNLLPEGHLRTYLSDRLRVRTQREFFLLGALGDDLPGAVRVTSDNGLVDEDNEGSSVSLVPDDALRFSLAGVQLKFSAIVESNGRLTIPVKGQGGCWIVKVPAGRFANVPEAEFAMMTLASKAGINVPEIKLVTTETIRGLPGDFRQITGDSFAIRRFDRRDDDGTRIHMEDFAQVFGFYSDDKYNKRSYANIAEVLWVEASNGCVAEFIRRLVFNILIGNGDMHLKNWSLIYRDPAKPELSPAYDFLPTVAFLERQELGLSLGGTKEFEEIDVSHFQRLAAVAKIPERFILKNLEESREACYAAWQEYKTDLPLKSVSVRAIQQHINSLSLFKSKLV